MRFRAVLVALAGSAALSLLPSPAQAAGPNLLLNPGFERGLNTTSAQGIDQPLLPLDWAFEGAAGLFDHSPHSRKAGRYGAAISAPASGKRQLCVHPAKVDPVPATTPGVGCIPFTPVNDAKDTAATAYSANPAWRPQLPVAVQGGRAYTISGWFMWQFATINEGGAQVRVRWLDANGVPIRTDTPFMYSATTAAESDFRNWMQFTRTLTAPANARQAVPLFGLRDDVWNTHLAYDEVYFGLA